MPHFSIIPLPALRRDTGTNTTMPVNAERIAQLEMALAEARAELLQENGRRYDIIMREISPDEKERILDSLTDRKERILFGLEAPERAGRPGKSGGDLECPICHKKGLTPRGLHLHTVRTHKGEEDPATPALFPDARRGSPRAAKGEAS